MKALAAVVFAGAVLAQDGAELYRTNCAVPYCHGPNGTAGRAPAVAGRGYARDKLLTILRDGIRGTAMPGFGPQLSAARIDALMDYLMSLQGPPSVAGEAKPAQPELPADARKGRALFFDATRMGNCGTCHEAGGWGIAIGPALAGKAHKLDAIATPNLVTAKVGAEAPFPAVVVARSATEVKLYDLSSTLPVLRTLAPSSVTTAPGAGWTHARALALYTASEQELLVLFLRSASR